MVSKITEKLTLAVLIVASMAAAACAAPQKPPRDENEQNRPTQEQNQRRPMPPKDQSNCGNRENRDSRRSEYREKSGRNDQSCYVREMGYKNGGLLEVKLGGGKNNDARWNRGGDIKVRDSRGRSYSATVKRNSNNILTLLVKGLVKGEKYTLDIPGVYSGSNRNNKSDVRCDFTARDGWSYRK